MAKIDIKATIVFQRLSEAYNSKKYNGYVLPGGTRSSKTHSIIQFMLMYCQQNYNKNKKILIARQAYADLKDTVMRDFFDILRGYGLYKEKYHTRSNPQSYKYMGNTIYFRGLDAGGSHGEAYDVVWINEAFEAELDAFRQLNQRLRGFFIMDYNPCFTEHWILENILKRPDVWLSPTSTILDNPFAPEQNVKEVLAYDPSKTENVLNGTADDFMWKVYGLGQMAAREGVIFKYVTYIPEFPANVDYWYGQDLGFTCFIGDTDIQTTDGLKKIKNIRCGDHVLTSGGYKKVLKLHKNGIKEVVDINIEFDFGYRKISCTLDHKFKTTKGWKQLKDLQKGDILYLNAHLTAKYIEDTQKENTEIIFLNQKQRPDCIGIFGNIIEAKYRKACKFITSIIIRLIILLRTLFSLQIRNIENFTITLKDKNQNHRFQKKTGKKEELNQWKQKWEKKINVIGVALNLFQQMSIKDSVVGNAITNINIKVLNAMKRIFVKFAQELLIVINILNKKLVRTDVRIYCRQITDVKITKTYNEDVFDLRVEDVHEYFANGILVHNCDPTALAKIYIDEPNKQLYAECLMYESTENPMLINDYFNSVGIERHIPIICDSSDKYISQNKGAVEFVKELKLMGWNISKVSKTHDRYYWIGKAHEYKLNIVFSKDRPALGGHVKKEFENFMWRRINGIQVNQPVDKWDHFISAMLYGMMGNKNTQRRKAFWN